MKWVSISEIQSQTRVIKQMCNSILIERVDQRKNSQNDFWKALIKNEQFTLQVKQDHWIKSEKEKPSTQKETTIAWKKVMEEWK